MSACTAYELTLIIELIVLETSNKETAKIVILCVHAGLYVHFGIHLACKHVYTFCITWGLHAYWLLVVYFY